MDGVSGAASILQLAQVAGKAALELYNFVSVIKNAPEEIGRIRRDIHAFYALICSLTESLESPRIQAAIESDPEINISLRNLQFPLNNCRSTIARVISTLSPYLKAEPPRFSREQFLWFFRRKEVYTLAMDLERSKETLGEAMGGITVIITLKTSAALHGSKFLPADFQFSEDLGRALKGYSESVSAEDGNITLNEAEDQSAGGELLRSDPEASQELKAATISGSISQAKEALGRVAVDARDRKGRTALSHAAEHGNIEVAKILLGHGPVVSARQWSLSGEDKEYEKYFDCGATPIYWAAKRGHVLLVDLLLRHGANPNCRTTSGRTPLQEACKDNSFECAKLLLSKKADVDAQSYNDGWSSLHEAAYNKRIELVQLLLHNGASPDVQLVQPESKTPLHFAVQVQCPKVLQLLLKHDANPNAQMLEDITPLHLAAAGGWENGIKLLVDAGAWIDARDAFLHEAPLHKAARNCETKAIKVLCDLGANTETRNVDGQRYEDILHLAIVSPEDWRVGKHLGSYLSTNVWWAQQLKLGASKHI